MLRGGAAGRRGEAGRRGGVGVDAQQQEVAGEALLHQRVQGCERRAAVLVAVERREEAGRGAVVYHLEDAQVLRWAAEAQRGGRRAAASAERSWAE